MMARLYLIPNLLAESQWQEVIPEEVRQKAISIRHFAVENIREARRYLRKLDRDFDIDGSDFQLLNKDTDEADVLALLRPLKEGQDMGVISDAGCPGVADPGSKLVRAAHESGIQVVSLVGPSSILLALMGSGLNGQRFAFRGYIPKERKDRIAFLREMENRVFAQDESQIFMDTPFRNIHVLEDVLDNCKESLLLTIACDLTGKGEYLRTKSIANWKKSAKPDLNKRPCMFLLGK